MKIQPIFKKTQKPQPSFGMRYLPTKKMMYAPNCYIEKEFGKYKGYDIIISKNFTNNKITSRLIYIKDEYGKWLKSKLKYFDGEMWKVLRGDN